MKSRLLILLLFTFVTSALMAQKEYRFDYMLQYDSYNSISKKTDSQYFFVNSSDNSFILSVLDSEGKVEMFLKDVNAKIYHSKMPREDFFVLMIAMRCPLTLNWNNDRKNETRYEYANARDSLINAVPYYHFEMRPPNKKKDANKNLKPIHYLYTQSENFSMPVVLTNRFLYDLWKEGGQKFSGLLSENYILEADGSKRALSKLVTVLKIEKIIIVDTTCK